MSSSRFLGTFLLFCAVCLAPRSAFADKATLKFHLDFTKPTHTGPIVRDKVNSAKAVRHNTPWTKGRFGDALYFNGKKGRQGAYVIIPQSERARFLRNFENGPFTLEVWFKPDKDFPANHQNILGNTTTTRACGYRLVCTPRYDMCPFVVGVNDHTKPWALGPEPKSKCVVAGVWNHVAIVRDAKGMITYYGNGIKHSYYGPHKVDKSKQPVEMTEGGQPLILGAMKPNCPYYPFKGIIDDLRIYKGARTAAEIYAASQGLEGNIALNLDGRLDEALWKNAKRFTGFRLLRTGGATAGKGGALAEVQTEAIVAHDAHYVYFGMTAHEPSMDKLKDICRTNSEGVYSDDSLEIMLDADGSQANYYHMLMNSSGYKTQMMSIQGGTMSVPWQGNWFVATTKSKDRWTAEVAVPLAALNREDSMTNRLRFNVARNRRVDLPRMEESSLLPGGEFHEPTLFLPYDAQNVETAQYLLRSDHPTLEGTALKNGRLHTVLAMAMKNTADRPANATLHTALIAPNGEVAAHETALSLAAGQSQPLSLPFNLAQPGTYTLSLMAKRGNRIVFDSTTTMAIDFVPLQIDITQPFYRNSIYFTEQINEIRATIKIGLLKKAIANKTLKATLRDSKGKAIAEKTYASLARRQNVRLAIPQLAPGKYAFTATLMEQGKAVEETSESIHKLPKAPGSEVRVDERLRLLIDGKPTLPIMWWGELEATAKADGDGVLTGFGGKGAMANLDTLHGLSKWGGIMIGDSRFINRFLRNKETLSNEARQFIAERVNTVKSHPALLYYYLIDEPECAPFSVPALKEAYAIIRELDPYHPVAACNNSLAGLYTYAECLDVFLPDPYMEPVINGGLLRPMMNAVRTMNTARKAGKGRKMIGMTPQVFSWTYKPGRRSPTFTEERCHQYLGIVRGARMLKYYKYGGFDDSPDLMIGIAPLISEIKALTPMILHGVKAKGIVASDPALHLLAHNHAGKLFIIACNAEPKSVSASITLPDNVQKLQVLSEGRQVTAAKERLVENFAPYAVHIYTSDLHLQSPISLGNIEQKLKAAGGMYSLTYKE